MISAKSIAGPMRLPFVVLAPICVILGIATAHYSGIPLSWFHIIMAIVAGLMGHISVNAFNEYADFKSGLDFHTTRTPFSGGSGTLPEQPEMAGVALATAWISLLIAAAIGIYFILLRGWVLAPLGLLGVATVLGYSKWFTRHSFLCLVSPGLGFGPVMVIGTYVALTGQYAWSAIIASLVPFFLVSDLLLLNQFPDVEPDQSVGRRHYPIVMGRKNAVILYAVFLLLAYLSLVSGVATQMLPVWSLLGLGTLPLAIKATQGALKYADDKVKIIPSLIMNVLINLLTPLLISIGIFLTHR